MVFYKNGEVRLRLTNVADEGRYEVTPPTCGRLSLWRHPSRGDDRGKGERGNDLTYSSSRSLRPTPDRRVEHNAPSRRNREL